MSRRIVSQRDQYSYRFSAVPQTLYRGVHLNLNAKPGERGAPTPEMLRIIRSHGVGSKEFLDELLRHPAGTYYSAHPSVAENFANQAGDSDIGMVLTVDWDGHDQDVHHNHLRSLPESWGVPIAPPSDPFREIRVKKGKPLRLRSIKVRERKGEPWRELFKTAPAIIEALLRKRVR